MNRHQRRATAARARQGARTGYMHRILAGGRLDHLIAGKAGIFVTNIEHDGWCTIYQSGLCNCIPNISINIDGTVHTIDENGEVSAKQKVS